MYEEQNLTGTMISGLTEKNIPCFVFLEDNKILFSFEFIIMVFFRQRC